MNHLMGHVWDPRILALLSRSWEDDELEQMPSLESIEKAEFWLNKIDQENLNLLEVDFDVLGGVAIYLGGCSIYRDREIWISIINGGVIFGRLLTLTIVATEKDYEQRRVRWTLPLNDKIWKNVVEFLRGDF